jgi:uncharacterized protein
MLTKIVATELKAGPEDGLAEGEFVGYASVFNNKDSYGDVVIPGAFLKDLGNWEASGDPIPCLYGHNMSDPDFNIGGTLSAKEDEKGLRVHVKLDLENPKALSTYRLLKGRRIRQMSFAYDVIAGGYATRPKAGQEDEDNPDTEEYYELRELKLYEVSVVPVGANQETEILAVKSLQHLADRIEAMSALGDTKAGRVLSSKNEEELRGAYDAIGRVLATIDGASDEEKASGDSPSRQDTGAPESREASDDQPSVDTSELDRLSLDLELSV